jgi:hypothetical protein
MVSAHVPRGSKIVQNSNHTNRTAHLQATTSSMLLSLVFGALGAIVKENNLAKQVNIIIRACMSEGSVSTSSRNVGSGWERLDADAKVVDWGQHMPNQTGWRANNEAGDLVEEQKCQG